MKKETLADKLAKKSFMSEAVQKSWKVHMDMFGPILEPAFKEDYQSKVHLGAALNLISRKDVKKGFEKLVKLEKKCANDADMAAWLFFMGICFEFSDMKDEMMEHYLAANSFKHDYYLPYMKVAKHACEDGVYDVAEENFKEAIRCLEMNMLAPQNKLVLASAYASLTTCYIMMHRLDEAEETLEFAKKLQESQLGRTSIEAVLFAVKGEKEQAEKMMDEVKKELPAAFDKVRADIDKIYDKVHPQFFEVPLKESDVTAFWEWFAKEEKTLIDYIAQDDFEEFFCSVQLELKKVFPFIEREPDFAVEPNKQGCSISFADYYMVALGKGYEKIIEACPEKLKDKWSMEIVH